MRRAIAGQRGSVRGAPVQTSIPFGEFHNDPEPWRDAIHYFKVIGYIAMGWTIIYVIGVFLWAIGCVSRVK